MKDKSIKVIFWLMVVFFIIIIGTMFIDVPLNGNLPGYFLLPSAAIFIILGVTMLVLTLKRKIGGTDRIFLLLTGASAVGLPVFVVLHNLVTALIISLFNITGDFDEPVFFILATIICPLGFLVGAIGNIVMAVKNRTGRLAV